jgi:hypothetical protein
MGRKTTLANDNTADRQVDRRRLLRRAGTVAAGVAGAGIVSAVASSPANAADGDTVTLGQANTESSTTSITSSGSGAALELNNTFLNGSTLEAGPALRLVPSNSIPASDADGNVGMTEDGVLWTTSLHPDGGTYAEYVYSPLTANATWAINPVRALDTRSSAGQSRILNAAGNLDSGGRILGGHTIDLDISDLVDYGLAAFGNLTIVSPSANGYVTLYPYGTTRPSTSSINFQTSTLSNSFVSGLGQDLNATALTSVLSIYARVTTGVIVDITALVTQYQGDVLTPVPGAGVMAMSKTRTRLRRPTSR